MDVINPHRFSTAAPAVDFDGFGNASRYFDGVNDYIDLGDSDDFSFGDGAGNDSPFSVSAWIKMEDATTFRILGKYNAPFDQEWLFVSDGQDRLAFFLVTDGTGHYISRRYSDTTTFNSYVGQWIHVVGTYDGSKSVNGIKLYINGSRVDDITVNSGTYAGMVNTTVPCEIGSITYSNSRSYAKGHIADCRLYNSELSSTDIAAIYGGENITTNLVGHWLKDTPSLLDHSGTNDGTNVGSAFAYDNPSPAVEFGKASREFDGNDHVDTNSSFNTTFQASFSFACWVRFADGTPASTNSIFGNQENAPLSRWLFLLGTDGKIQSNYHSNGNTSFAKINTSFSNGDTGWMHLACVITPSGQTLYLNGSQATLDPTQTGDMSGVTMGDYDSTIKFFIGARSFNNSPDLYLNGNLADVRIYDTDLSSTDIAAIYNGTHVETNLVGHWLTNTDDVKDYAGVNDGTNNGSTYSFDNPLSEGEFGSVSRGFNGSQYIEVTDDAAFPTGSQTWCCWVKVDNTSGSKTFVAKNVDTNNQRGGRIRLNNAQVQVYISADGTASWTTVFSSSSLSANRWYHLAMVFSPSTHLKIYIDGVEDASNTTSIPSQIYDNTAPFCIGSLDTTQQFQVGNIADVRIYDTDLTATDIFNLSRGYDYRTNLVGQWLTNKDDVNDYAGSNNGTNNGSTYSQDAPL